MNISDTNKPMTIIVQFTNDKLGYLYKGKPHFIQISLNEMKLKQRGNIEYGFRSPLLKVVEGYVDEHRKNLRRWPNGHFHWRILPICQLLAMGSLCLWKPNLT